MKETRFKTYQEAYNEALMRARESNADFGLENLRSCIGPNWRIWRLPAKQYRFGYESRCQIVTPQG